MHSTEVAYLPLTQQPRVQVPAFQKNFRGKIIDVAVVNKLPWLEESGQWLENVDQTLLVQAFDKKVLQKHQHDCRLSISRPVIDPISGLHRPEYLLPLKPLIISFAFATNQLKDFYPQIFFCLLKTGVSRKVASLKWPLIASRPTSK